MSIYTVFCKTLICRQRQCQRDPGLLPSVHVVQCSVNSCHLRGSAEVFNQHRVYDLRIRA